MTPWTTLAPGGTSSSCVIRIFSGRTPISMPPVSDFARRAGIVSRVPDGTSWMQFVVDSAGHPDLKSLLLPAGTLARLNGAVTGGYATPQR